MSDRSNQIKEILNGFVESQGWDNKSVITILCQYIGRPLQDGDVDVLGFRDFLRQLAFEENQR